ncbi:Gldg family protein [Aliikangiella sp. IMCC44359]|uniref:Gldg family protein n=1 Tax=Aliikangiella sp. IMCC44359 TaxID=3459125 RepID=UPI00403AEFF6
MNSLFKLFFSIVIRRPTTLLGVLATALSLGLFAKLGYQQFLYLQAQNISLLSVFNEVIIPLAGLTLVGQFLMSILASVQLIPSIKVSGQASLLDLSSLNSFQLLSAVLKPITLLSLWPLLYFCLIVFVLMMHTQLDLIRLSILTVNMLVIGLCINFWVLACCLLVSRPLIASMLSAFSILAVISFEMSLRFWWSDSPWHGLFLPYFSLREGLIRFADIAVYLGWIIFGFCSCYLFISRYKVNDSKAIKLGASIGIVFILLAKYFPGQVDLSRDLRSSISQSTIEKLLAQNDVLHVTAVINDETSREEVLRGFQIIQQVSPKSELEFRSRQNLELTRQQTGEYIEFSLGKAQQFVAYPFAENVKSVFETAVTQLLNRKQQWITFIEGHGEASLFASKSSDLSELHLILKESGWPVAAQNLTKSPVISENTNLLVIPASKQQWLSAEIELVMGYLKGGGNLLLLLDPDSIIPEQIMSFTNIRRYPGTLVDWNGFQSGTPYPAVVIINQMLDHPITRNINSIIALPWTSGLFIEKNKKNTQVSIEPIIKTHQGVWNEFKIQQEQLTFDQKVGEQQKSFDVALAHTNQANQQKIVVVGDSHFISDTAINNYANKQFAMNLISWLTNIETTKVQQGNVLDKSIKPSRWLAISMNWFFTLILPVLILLFWLLLYRKYHYAK